MFGKLPDLIDPIYSVNHNKHFDGRVNQSRFKRLAEVVESTDHDVDVTVDFYYDKALKFPAFIMKLETSLNLQCQRSMKAFDLPVKTEVKGVFTESLALAEDVPTDVEVFVLEGEKISLIDWIEEELLLSVPIAPINENSSMSYENDFDPTVEDQTNSAEDGGEEKTNPFAALQGLKIDS